jgi:hypothetical protein
MSWLDHVLTDPRPWLLDPAVPAVRAAALRMLEDLPVDDPKVRAARRAAMAVDPIKAILEAQDPQGFWVKPGPGYAPKYTGTVWSVIFLDQLGADQAHPQIRLACDYVLRRCPASSGGLGASGAATEAAPPPSSVVHCLHGNLLRALLGFGHLDDERVQAGLRWAARAITGEHADRWYASGTSGPGFRCGANDGEPCAWGAVKELRALARVPTDRRDPLLQRALAQGVAFLLSRDPADADYPMGYGNNRPSASWFKPGFPSGYVTDVLQVVEVLAELGLASDDRLRRALAWVEGGQDPEGRWRNRYAYNGKTWADIEAQGRPSKWVTLRACAVLRAAYGDT